jgi:CBS domain-containing protein
MKIKNVMVKNVTTCGPDDNVAEIAAKMWDARCGSVPVLDDRGTVTRLITDRDICIALGTRNVRASELKVKDVSLPRVFSCGPDDDVPLALKTMVAQNVRRLPVVDDMGKLAGILSIDDLLLHSEKTAGKTGISHEDVVNAAKLILTKRSREAVHEPAELIAAGSSY